MKKKDTKGIDVYPSHLLFQDEIDSLQIEVDEIDYARNVLNGFLNKYKDGLGQLFDNRRLTGCTILGFWITNLLMFPYIFSQIPLEYALPAIFLGESASLGVIGTLYGRLKGKGK